MQRRKLLKLGAGAAVLLALAGGGVSLYRPALLDGQLTPAGQAVFKAVARAVLDGSLPVGPAAEASLALHLTHVGEVIHGFPPAVQAELAQLLAVVSTAPGRRLLAGLSPDWPEATVEQVQSALDDMRRSGITARQQAYNALRDITNAAFYADPSAWPLIGYPGPRAL
ncbi:MAG TPA: hypothetical protein VGD46_01330 [Rhizobacter sp.]